MEHITEYAIILTNLMLFLVSLALTIVTGIDNHAMAKIAALAVGKLAPKKVAKIAEAEDYKPRHQA
jgi:hypothetical protein